MSWLGAVPGLPPGSPSVLNSQRCSPASQPSWLRARPTERRLRLAHGAPLSEVASGTTPFPRPLQSPFTPRHTSLRTPQQEGGAAQPEEAAGAPLVRSVLPPSARDALDGPPGKSAASTQ